MGSTFFGLVDMGLLGSPMGPLGSPSIISYFILFKIQNTNKENQNATRFYLFFVNILIVLYWLCCPNLLLLILKRIKYEIRLGEPNGPIGEPNRPMSTSPKRVEPILRVGP